MALDIPPQGVIEDRRNCWACHAAVVLTPDRKLIEQRVGDEFRYARYDAPFWECDVCGYQNYVEGLDV